MLKENSVDCLLSNEGSNMSVDKFDKKSEQIFANQKNGN